MRDRTRDHAVTGGKFVVVAGLGFVVHLSLYALLLSVGLHYVVASAIGYVVGWGSNLVLHRAWTFPGAASAPLVAQARRSAATSAVVLGVNVAVLALVVRLGVAELPAQAVTTAIVAPVSYVISRRWAFAAPTAA